MNKKLYQWIPTIGILLVALNMKNEKDLELCGGSIVWQVVSTCFILALFL